MTEEQIKQADEYNWWHRIKLSDTHTTKGLSTHCTNPEDFETVFGFPASFKGKSVLDVGGWDGMFSFEAEKRNAKYVMMIDIYQPCQGQHQGYNTKANEPFCFAKGILKSEVYYSRDSLETYCEKYCYLTKYDYVFYFGVLYHIENPLGAVRKLLNLTNNEGTILFETAITDLNVNRPILEYRPGYFNDPTNQFYPNEKWIVQAFLDNGAKSVSEVYNDGVRVTYRITK